MGGVVMEHGDIDRILAAVSTLSDSAHHRLMQMEGSAHPCPAATCTLSAEEHHRLAYGLLAENRELRRRLAEFENGNATTPALPAA